MLWANCAIWSLGHGHGPTAFKLFSSIATIVIRSSRLASGAKVQVMLPILSSKDVRKELKLEFIAKSKSDAQTNRLRLPTRTFFSKKTSIFCTNFKIRIP